MNEIVDDLRNWYTLAVHALSNDIPLGKVLWERGELGSYVCLSYFRIFYVSAPRPLVNDFSGGFLDHDFFGRWRGDLPKLSDNANTGVLEVGTYFLYE